MYLRLSRLAVFIAATLAATCLVAEEQVLYWMIDGSATVNDHGTESTIGSFFTSYESNYETTHPGESKPENFGYAARIRVTGGNISDSEDRYLGLYYIDPDTGSIMIDSGESGVPFGDFGGYWGAGVPTGNQSPSGGYSNGNPEFTFIVELGNITWDDNSVTWVDTVATSEAVGYSTLAQAHYIHEAFDVNPPAGQIWTPTAFTVPEPSGGLLIIVGGALLALRRRRVVV